MVKRYWAGYWKWIAVADSFLLPSSEQKLSKKKLDRLERLKIVKKDVLVFKWKMLWFLGNKFLKTIWMFVAVFQSSFKWDSSSISHRVVTKIECEFSTLCKWHSIDYWWVFFSFAFIALKEFVEKIFFLYPFSHTEKISKFSTLSKKVIVIIIEIAFNFNTQRRVFEKFSSGEHFVYEIIIEMDSNLLLMHLCICKKS